MKIKDVRMIGILASLICICTMQTTFSQTQPAKENMPINTLQEYKWWNLLHYTIDIIPDYNAKFISGTNKIQFVALQVGKVMQIDLQQPMLITAITWNNKPIQFKKDE